MVTDEPTRDVRHQVGGGDGGGFKHAPRCGMNDRGAEEKTRTYGLREEKQKKLRKRVKQHVYEDGGQRKTKKLESKRRLSGFRFPFETPWKTEKKQSLKKLPRTAWAVVDHFAFRGRKKGLEDP